VNQTLAKAESPFFKGTTLQFAWDNTSLGYFMECPRKYYYTILQGWRKKDESVHLTFGGWFASAMEVFHHSKARGESYDDALDATVQYILEVTWLRTEEYEGPWTPDNSPKKNRETLLRTVIWYFEEYKDDPAKCVILPNGEPATELSFRFDIGIANSLGEPFLYSGHLDKLVDFGGDIFVMDQKTTGGSLGPFYFAQYDLDNQMSGYTLAGRVIYNVPVQGVIIDAAAILVGSTTFGRSITMRSKGQLEEWVGNVADYLHLAEVAADTGHYPMNLKSCNNYGGCVFKGVCNKDPSVRSHFLETDFEKKFWNPLETR
jgi:hypothetical protein